MGRIPKREQRLSIDRRSHLNGTGLQPFHYMCHLETRSSVISQMTFDVFVDPLDIIVNQASLS
jgi:hypothetical protein